jgi:hypothetical protein
VIDGSLVCPCDGCQDAGLSNPSGLSTIAYRITDFTSLRHALLLHRHGEVALAAWRPSATDDLGLQIVEWWAYLGDVLTFYNERIANLDYVRTAPLVDRLGELVAVLGYRPRPGIGATATLAAVASRPVELDLPSGFQVASKASPGHASQIFETTKGVTFLDPTSAPGPGPEDLTTPPPDDGPPSGAPPGAAVAPPHEQLVARGGVLVKGKPTTVAVGDRLLLTSKPWNAASDPARVVSVTGLAVEKDAYGKTNTRILVDGADGLSGSASGFHLMRSTAAQHLAQLPPGVNALPSGGFVLDSTARNLHTGDPLVLDTPGAGVGASPGSGFDVVRLTGYTEAVWYANAAASTPSTSPGSNGIPLLVASLTVDTAPGANLPATYGSLATAVIVRSGWVEVGMLLDTPVRTLSALPDHVILAQPPAAAPGQATPALAEDAQGNGASVSATPQAGSTEVAISGPPGVPIPSLEAPLRLLWDLFGVSRGRTVAGELIGIGDATVSGQDLALAQKPVTYLADDQSRSGDGYSSTIVLSVDGVYWSEVPDFFGQPADARVFVTHEDGQGATHVVLGDGVNGARATSGAQLVATYRVGSGADAPPASSLSTVLSPVPNLSSVRNPVAAGGGADPDPPDQLRRYAPRSVLTFGRAVSADDYAVVAGQAPGVTRAGSVLSWDPGQQRAVVAVYVGDDAAAVTSAKARLRAKSDPNREVVVYPARRRACSLSLTLLVEADRDPTPVSEAVRAALLDPLTGLFSPGVLALGEPLYRSRIEAACFVPGVSAVHDLELWVETFGLFVIWFMGGDRPRYVPGEGGYFDLAPSDLTINTEATSG